MMFNTLIGLVLISHISAEFFFRDLVTSKLQAINNAEYREISKFSSFDGKTKYKSQQQYKGVDIFGATLVVEDPSNTNNHQISMNERVLFPVYGTFYDTSTINIDINPLISSDAALQIAIQHYIPNGDKTDLFGYAWGESELTTTVLLNIYKDEEHGIDSFTLSYIIEFTHVIAETEDVERAFSVIDANSGDILYSFSAMVGDEIVQSDGVAAPNNVWGTGGNSKTGWVEHGPMSITARPQLRSTRVEAWAYPIIGSNNPTIGECAGGPLVRCEIQDTLVNTNPGALADAYKYAGVVFDLYDDWGPLNADGNPIPPLAPQFLPLTFYVHYGTNYENAFYSGGSMSFGDGLNRFYPLVSLDVSSHEVAHGFTSQGSNLQYSGQSGGINEAYSDLAGEAAEAYYRGEDTVKWTCGYDIDKSGNCGIIRDGQETCGLRYLYDPPLDGNSIDHVDNFFSSMNVHYSSGIYNSGWHNLSTTAGWNIQSVFLLASEANYFYWGQTTGFNVGLCGLQGAVDDLFPSNEHDARKNDIALAWGDQGVICQTNSIKSGISQNEGIDNNDPLYYVYGGVGAGVFVLFIGVIVLWFYRKRGKILGYQLNDNVGGSDRYGAIVTDDERI